MEDGIAIDSTAARWEHEALTSIHLDMNRYSQINPAGNYDVYTDINIPTNIISRFDFIMDIPANLKGDAPNSSSNAFSVNMDSQDRVASVPS